MNVLTNARNVNIDHLTTIVTAVTANHNTSIIPNTDANSRLNPIPDASFARDKIRFPPDSECLPGTREGVLEKITLWADKSIFSTASHVYWLYGYAGCGKSSISQAVAERFHSKGRLAASFFFFRSSDRRSRFNSVPATLASQMAEAIPATAPLILAALQADFSLLSKSVGTQMERLVYKPLKTATKWYRLGPGARAILKGPFLITIDSLDECEDKKDVEQFINHMLSYFSENPKLPLRVFIASRVEEHIRTRLDTGEVCLDNLIDHPPDEDITAFILARFTRAAKNDRVVQAYGPSWPKSTDVDGLAKLGKGSFIFVSMLLKYIFETVDDGFTPMQRLPRALKMKSSLDGLYTSTLSRSEHLPHFSSIISTLTYLQGPLPTSSIAELLNIELYEVIAVLVNLQAIIQLPGNDITPVTLCHSSLQDFLTTESRSGPFFSQPITHKNIAYRCLDLLIRHRRTDSIILSYAHSHLDTHLELASKALNYDQHYYRRVVTYMNQHFPTSFPLVLSTYFTMQPGESVHLSKPLADLLRTKASAFDLGLIAQVLIRLSKRPNAYQVLESFAEKLKQSLLAPDVTHYTFLAKQCIRYLALPWLLEGDQSAISGWTIEYVFAHWAKHVELAVIHDPAMSLEVLQEDCEFTRVTLLSIPRMQENVARAVEAIQHKFPGALVSNFDRLVTFPTTPYEGHVVQVDGPVSILTLLVAFQQVNLTQPTRLSFVGEGVILTISLDHYRVIEYSVKYSTTDSAWDDGWQLVEG